MLQMDLQFLEKLIKILLERFSLSYISCRTENIPLAK